MKDYPGYLIAFEGIDGTGKTTLAKNLRKRFKEKNFEVCIFKEPTSETVAGKKIRESYESERASVEQELAWFMKDRAWDVNNRIIPALKEGKIVFLDRYYYSTACYQGVRKNGDWEAILQINREKFPEPDLTIILDVEPEKALKRIKNERKKENTFEEIEELSKIRDLFVEIIKKDSIGNFLYVDSSIPLIAIENQLYKEITKVITNQLF